MTLRIIFWIWIAAVLFLNVRYWLKGEKDWSFTALGFLLIGSVPWFFILAAIGRYLP